MSIQIQLERSEHEPGGVVRGKVVSNPPVGQEDRKVELSVLWQTDGKGDTDLGVPLHRELDRPGTHDFEVRLPLLPVSYSGTLLKIRWLVRVRRHAPLGDDEIEEKEFVVRWPAA